MFSKYLPCFSFLLCLLSWPIGFTLKKSPSVAILTSRAKLQIDTFKQGGAIVIDDVKAITPNGDGKNDKLQFKSVDLSQYPNNSLQIVNRWGQSVFNAKPYNNDWQGENSFTNSPLPEGNYFYMLQLGKGDTLYKGTVYLHRPKS